MALVGTSALTVVCLSYAATFAQAPTPTAPQAAPAAETPAPIQAPAAGQAPPEAAPSQVAPAPATGPAATP